MTENKKANPKVSIIMPTYNRAHLIDKAIDSVLKQTFEDYELIIIDDGSSDNTEDVVMRYNDSQIIYLKKKHKNAASARNHGLKRAKGEYIAYCDDDCQYYPYHLQKLTDYLDSHLEVEMVCSDGLWCKPWTKPVRLKFNLNKQELETQNPLIILTVMHRRKCLDKVGLFDEKLFSIEDWDMWLRISDFSPIAHLPIITGKHFHYKNTPTLTDFKSNGRSIEYLIKKRVSLAKKGNRLSTYINLYSFELIKMLLFYKRLSFAYSLSNYFYNTIKNYQTAACLGIYNLTKGKFGEAKELFREALQKIPNNYQRHKPSHLPKDILTIKLNLAKAYYHLGKIASATKICRQVLKLVPRDKETKAQLALCYANRASCHKALNLVKGIPTAHHIRGYCYFKMKRYKHAISEFEKAIALSPMAAVDHYNLATVYAKIGNYNKAVSEYRKASQPEPQV